MKAFVLIDGELKLKEMEEPAAETNEVLVSLKAAGLNRRDLSIPNRYGENKEALILGSDGAGIVEAVGNGVRKFDVGDEVIINPSLNWEKKSDGPPKGFDILGMPSHGTFAEKIVISEKQLEKKPAHLNWEEAGVLALSALTGYRALITKGQLASNETVFIPGAGSGVSTYMIMFAKNIGAKVVVTSRSAEKRQQAKELGADIIIDTNSDWTEALTDETIDLVIDSVGGATFNRSLEILRKGGKIVIFGSSTEDQVSLNLRQFFYGQYQLIGSTMGSREELREALEHIKKYEVHPVLDLAFELEDTKEAMELLQNTKQFGKIALRIKG